MKNCLLLLTITVVWLAYIIIVLEYFHIPKGLLWIPFFMLIFFIKPVFWMIGSLKRETFKCVKKGEIYQVHMSIYASVYSLDKPKLKAFKKSLLDSITMSIEKGAETITMRSHILSEHRIAEIHAGIKRAFPSIQFNVTTNKVKTGQFESMMLRAHFLITEWRFVEVWPSSLEATFKKL